MSQEYALCQYCNKSNPIIEAKSHEQTCIFCGQPFMVQEDKKTQLISEPENTQQNRIPIAIEQREPIDVNQKKPVNKNKRKPLR